MIVPAAPQGSDTAVVRNAQKSLRYGGAIVITATEAGVFHGDRLARKVYKRKLRATKSAAPVLVKGAGLRRGVKLVLRRKEFLQSLEASRAAPRPDDLARARARIAALAPGFTDDLRDAPPFPAGVPEILGSD